ncbi:M56 family metallopeptidase [Rubeoparvulum massiliense]|uniref:M56 family metallopeptidase n=1 Tax=Rubeoparvulum massiliense TaxID=1631346 RepID=UPI00069ED6DB|nr:M56 family metallopeptidase [Rubeoparvulum massiliense]
MLEKVFLQILNMSYIGSIVVLFILAARILLKKAPKKFSYLLWAVALFRLIVPVSFESIVSLIPVNPAPIPNDIMYNPSPQINTGVSNIDHSISSSLPVADATASVNPMQVWIFIGSLLWIIGTVVLLIYGMVSLMRMTRKLNHATYEKENIYHSVNVETPFVLGLIQPKIYLPASLSESERKYILLHEQTHIKRFDHVIRFISYLVLCIHWFNPFVWIAFWLSGKDMEMSCDESVISQLGHGVKKEYSQSLLNLATGKRNLRMTPLAFGEGDTKGRIKNILRYKEPKFWVAIVAVIAVVVISIGLINDPQDKQLSIEDYANQFIDETIAANDTDDYYFKIIDRKITKLEKIASIDELLPTGTLEIWSLEYRLKPEDMSKIILAGGMNEVNGWITEETSMGKPLLVFSYEHSTPQFLGPIWSGEAELSTLAGQETALRIFLEKSGMVSRETYSGNHIVIQFPLSTGETCQLLLSQPVIQGDHGIWCVERWMDGNGSVYYVTPKTDIRLTEYFQKLQDEVDQGHKPWLMDPLQVAIEWINNDLGQNVSLDELELKYSATVKDFMVTPVSHFIGFISDFETAKYSKPYFHLDQIEWLTLEDNERLEELNIDPNEDMPNGFYIHNPHNYPMFFQVTEDTKYNIIVLGEEVTHKSVNMEDFIKHLEQFSDFTPPFWVTTKDGYVQDITEQYVP